MRRVDYDQIASEYDRRYSDNRYGDIERALHQFVGDDRSVRVGEVGCGTGHWLTSLGAAGYQCVGLDVSLEMLRVAAVANPGMVARGTAHALPWRDGSLDRLFVINALHHFGEAEPFIGEARRVVKPGGSIFIAGLDPHNGADRWWVYDYFPGTLEADLRRYPSTARIRALLARGGFAEPETFVAQHLPADMPFETAEERGLMDRRWTSQLMVISDEEYDAGAARLRRERPHIRADLRVFATTAR